MGTFRYRANTGRYNLLRLSSRDHCRSDNFVHSVHPKDLSSAPSHNRNTYALSHCLSSSPLVSSLTVAVDFFSSEVGLWNWNDDLLPRSCILSNPCDYIICTRTIIMHFATVNRIILVRISKIKSKDFTPLTSNRGLGLGMRWPITQEPNHSCS